MTLSLKYIWITGFLGSGSLIAGGYILDQEAMDYNIQSSQLQQEIVRLQRYKSLPNKAIQVVGAPEKLLHKALNGKYYKGLRDILLYPATACENTNGLYGRKVIVYFEVQEDSSIYTLLQQLQAKLPGHLLLEQMELKPTIGKVAAIGGYLTLQWRYFYDS